jgi:uncharacterized protein YcnI
MKLRTPAIITSALGAGVLLALAAPLAASAHVGDTPDSTAAGSYTVLTFAVPHGCDGSATTAVAIDLPESIPSVTPTVNPGWTVAKTVVKLDTPITDASGAEITERVSQVVYTAITPLPDGYRDTFALSLKLPDEKVGDAIEFPVLQSCEVGSTEWNEPTPASGDEPEHPAPSITLTAATGDEHGHATADADDADGAHEDASTTDAADAQPDVLARVLGVLGLVAGAVGVVIAVVSRRRAPAGK